jgi:hypothetical protein
MYNHCFKQCYINIPKNASSFMRESFKESGWKHMHCGMSMEIDNVIVILRDPIDRWLSGIAQHITTNILGENFGSTHFLELSNELVEKIIFDQVVFDDHTEQQSWFLEPFDLSKVVFFEFNENLSANLDNYFASKGLILDLKNQPFINASKDSFDNANLIDYFRDKVYSNRQYYNRLKEYYIRDYDLITSIQFYGTR